ncbi:SRPBCC family protein [Nocardia terpenica]|uniref:Cyclase/dehydrase n=1 Tax=Nocardia terpenica TaxID=455432 RepID=A0A161Z6P1_9NOCA|nr:SRPBCC family protein [Nocardia terpenica]KZM75684.1 cyclase/dehydrase [Nocardia terpenica]MBF6064843.1 SRPBCC family protein [Nocardia terpenica]MBF6107358.1 SRPBCC family protein [Nocardia terpenica]MBF6115115.1 SRPBCC family protein [Nocardia terpenica]MBF6122221.1 SRPBCC family protein [Nocardia terpenica]
MRTAELHLRSERVDADEAFRRVGRLENYAAMSEDVHSVVVHPGADGAPATSDWEVFFRNGPLRWTEVDYFQPDRRRIVFEQTAGDFDMFRGSWRIEPDGLGCDLYFETTFDFGIDSLAGIMEPLAAKVLKEGLAVAVLRLLGDGEVIDDPTVAAVVADRIAVAGS